MKFKAGDRVVTKNTYTTPSGSHGTILFPWNNYPGNENYRIKFDSIDEPVYIGEIYLELESEERVKAPFANDEELICAQEASRRLFNQAATIKAQIKQLGERLVEIKNLKEENEQLRVQLTGCSVAANGATYFRSIANKGNYGWSVAYQDVLELCKKYDNLQRIIGAENMNDLLSYRFHILEDHLRLNDAATELGCDLDQVGNVIRKIKTLLFPKNFNVQRNAKPEPGLQGGLQGCGQAKVSEAPQREKIRETDTTVFNPKDLNTYL